MIINSTRLSVAFGVSDLFSLPVDNGALPSHAARLETNEHGRPQNDQPFGVSSHITNDRETPSSVFTKHLAAEPRTQKPAEAMLSGADAKDETSSSESLAEGVLRRYSEIWESFAQCDRQNNHASDGLPRKVVSKSPTLTPSSAPFYMPKAERIELATIEDLAPERILKRLKQQLGSEHPQKSKGCLVDKNVDDRHLSEVADMIVKSFKGCQATVTSIPARLATQPWSGLAPTDSYNSGNGLSWPHSIQPSTRAKAYSHSISQEPGSSSKKYASSGLKNLLAPALEDFNQEGQIRPLSKIGSQINSLAPTSSGECSDKFEIKRRLAFTSNAPAKLASPTQKQRPSSLSRHSDATQPSDDEGTDDTESEILRGINLLLESADVAEGVTCAPTCTAQPSSFQACRYNIEANLCLAV